MMIFGLLLICAAGVVLPCRVRVLAYVDNVPTARRPGIRDDLGES